MTCTRFLSDDRPAFVFVHGLGLKSNIWDPLIEQSKHLSSICINLLGHDEREHETYSFSDIFQNIVKDLENEKERELIFVLHSFAGALLPELVESELNIRKVIFVEGIIHRDDAVWTNDLPTMDDPELEHWVKRFRIVSEMALKSQLYTSQNLGDIKNWASGFRQISGGVLRNFASILTNRLNSDQIEKSLNFAKFPLEYIRGEKSRLSKTGQQFIIYKEIKLIILSNCGHFPMIDNPADMRSILNELD